MEFCGGMIYLNLVAGEADEEEKEMKVKETKRERS